MFLAKYLQFFIMCVGIGELKYQSSRSMHRYGTEGLPISMWFDDPLNRALAGCDVLMELNMATLHFHS